MYGRFATDRGVPAGDAAIRLVPVAAGDTIADVLRQVGIDPADVGHLFLNAEYSDAVRPVRGGDRLGVFPREMGLLYRQYFPKARG